MFDSAILEVIVGMLFVFSVVSILVTQINSLVSNVLKLRAKNLRKGIGDLVMDENIQAKIFSHPLIRLVKTDYPVLPSQELDSQEAKKIANGSVNNVSWIDPSTFVSVLGSILRVGSDQELYGALLSVVDEMPAGSDRRLVRQKINQVMKTGEGLDDLRELIGTLSSPSYRQALTEALNEIDDEIGQMGLQTGGVVSLMAGLRNVKNPFLESALETMISKAHSVEEATQQLEQWFNEGMDRATKTFESWMQVTSIAIGLILAVVINLDTLYIARTFWEDPALRTAVSATAESMQFASNVQTVQEAQGEENPEGFEAVEQSINDAGATLVNLLELRLPIGWYFEDLSDIAQNPDTPENEVRLSDSRNLWNVFALGINPNTPGILLFKLVGMFLTVMAVAQGAPFWFDILRMITRSRQADA